MKMSLKDWLRKGQLQPHKASGKEICDILCVVDRDLHDAAIHSVSPDRRFATAYNAILQLATMVIRAEGYRVAGQHHHWLTLQALPQIMPSIDAGRADYFDACRRKRNKVDYDSAEIISETEAGEALEEAQQFRKVVTDWLKTRHPDLLRSRS